MFKQTKLSMSGKILLLESNKTLEGFFEVKSLKDYERKNLQEEMLVQKPIFSTRTQYTYAVQILDTFWKGDKEYYQIKFDRYLYDFLTKPFSFWSILYREKFEEKLPEVITENLKIKNDYFEIVKVAKSFLGEDMLPFSTLIPSLNPSLTKYSFTLSFLNSDYYLINLKEVPPKLIFY